MKISSTPYRPKFNSELNIESILIAPLVAASKANVMMLSGQAQFILDYCFSLEKGVYNPVMVPMTMTRSNVVTGDSNSSTVELTFQVPLLCLLPINSLAVNEVKLNFDMEITSLSSYEANIKSNIVKRKAVLKGRLSSNNGTWNGKGKGKRKESTNLKVEIGAAPLPLPKGLLSIIDLYTNAIYPIPQSTATSTTSEEK